MRQRLLFSIVVMGMVCGSALAVNGDMGAGTEPLTDGSASYPYLIEDVNDFDAFANPANAATYWAAGVHTKLMTDIDLSGRTYTTAVIPTGYSNRYKAVFDGDSHTINNLTIDPNGVYNEYLALFGAIASDSEVKNLGIEDVVIRSNSTQVSGLIGVNSGTVSNCHVTGSISGWGMVAGICAANDGSIINSHAICTINGGSILGGLCSKNFGYLENCFTSCTIEAEEDSVGGLCGANFGNITNCHSSGLINTYCSPGGMCVYVGGLCGSNSGDITHCSSANDVVSEGDQAGGLCGFNSGNIVNCSSANDVICEGYYVGGLVGLNQGFASITACFSNGNVSGNLMVGGLVGSGGGSLTSCYATGDVSGIALVGGLVGESWHTISNCYSTGLVSGSSSIGGLIGAYNSSSISNAYFLNTAGPNNGYGAPLTEAQMMTQASFVGWDFVGETANGTDDIWRMCVDGVDYPRLWWEFAPADFVCGDGVDMVDFAYLANYWDLTGCNSGTDCGRADVDGSGDVGLGDLAAVANDWLQ